MALIFDSPAAAPDGLVFDSPIYIDTGAFNGIAARNILPLVSRSASGLFATQFNGLMARNTLSLISGFAGAAQDPNGITENDTWTEPVSIELVQDVAIGTLVLELNGLFTYTPPPEYIGIVTFQYRLWESGVPSNIGTVTITVEGDYAGQAVRGGIPLISGVSQLASGYTSTPTRAAYPTINYSAILTTGEQVPFIGAAQGSAHPYISAQAQLSTGFIEATQPALSPIASRAAQLSVGQANNIQRGTYPVINYSAILTTSEQIPFVGNIQRTAIPLFTPSPSLKIGLEQSVARGIAPLIEYSASLTASYSVVTSYVVMPAKLTDISGA